jgi:phenylacetate-coenzyme A ligase PaaK-like adenylate-forming protein
LRREVAALRDRYAAARGPADQHAVQLELLNRSWRDAREHVQFFAALARERRLPERFEHLEEFVERVPASGRETIQTHRAQLISALRPPDRWSATGGSTAQPIQIARWKSELAQTRANAWLGRSWYGVEPDDRLFLLWGHSHLLGTGVRGWFNARRRALEDRLLGYYRFSAYDIRDEAMAAAVERILSFRPAYLLGYSVALDRLARAAQARRTQLHALGIKAVIATAEGFPYPDSAERVSDAFGCPVAMEYGAVEALDLAYTHPSGGYRLFWRSYFAEAERRGERWVLRLTSLYPRSMPLVRYEIGDELELGADAPDRAIALTRFERLFGRCNDYVELADGTRLHSEVFSHAVRPCAAIRGYQAVQSAQELRLHVLADADVPAGELSGLRQRLAKIHAGLAEIPIERVSELARSIAGKTPMVIRR